MKKIIFLLLIYNVAFSQNADNILGVWLNEDNDAKIKIYKNEKDNAYSGKLIWLKEPFEENGSPKLDDENPKEELRNKELDGLIIVKNLKFNNDEWSGGSIYDPKSGKTYKCFAKINDNQLKLRGYIGFSFIGRTAIWTRAE